MPADCTREGINTGRCTCTYEPCPRKGICCECIDYHHRAGELPGCVFTKEEETTYDRSVSYFVRCRS